MVGRLIALLAVFLACAAPGCNTIQFEWQGPSDTFRNHDLNSDGDIDAFEWGQRYGSSLGASFSFRLDDCDRNGRVSWSEYFKRRFKQQYCVDTLQWMEQLDDETRRQSPFVLLPLSPVRTVNGQLQSATWLQSDRKPSTPGRYFEALLTTGQRDLVTVTTPESRLPVAVTVPEIEPAVIKTDVQVRGEPPPIINAPITQRFDTRSRSAVSTAWRLDFDVTNMNSQLLITLVDLEIQWERNGHSYHRRFLQTVWIPPSSSQQVYAWFPIQVDSANVYLRDVRGRPPVSSSQR